MLQTIHKRFLNCLYLKTDYFLYHFLTLVLHRYLFKLETGQGGSHHIYSLTTDLKHVLLFP